MKPGTRLASQVCSAEVVVVRVGSPDAELTCGGLPMVAPTPLPSGRPVAADESGPAPELGKRYVAADDSLEVLVVKAGTGGLAVGGQPLELKQAKALPSSD